MGTVRAPVHRARGGAPGVDLRPSGPGVRSRRGSRRPGDRGGAGVRPARRGRGRALAARARGRGREEHPAARSRRARRRRDAAARRHRRGGEARPLVRGGEGPGLRERRAGRGGAGAGRAVRALLVNWNDRANPHAGGAEIHLHEIFGRLARRGHAIDLVASGWPGCAPTAELDGLRVHRSGGRHSFALHAHGALRRLLRTNRYDVVVEDINKLPLYLPWLTDLPFCVIIPHLFGTTAFAEASWPVAAVVWAAELPIPRVYRRAAFHAISESTRDDLVRRGVPRERITVIHPGVDTTWYCPDGATPRTAQPTFLYVGRLKRYKGVEIALRALAAARARRADLVLEIAGHGDDRPRLDRLAERWGVREGVWLLGFVTDEEQRRQ